MTIQELLLAITNQLQRHTDAARLEAEILLAHAIAKPRHYLFMHPSEILSSMQQLLLEECIARRLQGEPIAYIVGKKEFWSFELIVNKQTLIPRPETELLVELVLEHITQPAKIADLGTGSGAVALALATERPKWEVVATDVNQLTLQTAIANATNLNINNVRFYLGEWCAALPEHDFDVIVTNPPYIAENEWLDYVDGLKFEPKEALVSGEDGLDAIRVIIQQAKNYLKPGGRLFVEHGFRQAAAIRELFLQSGYLEATTFRDLAGLERVTEAMLKK